MNAGPCHPLAALRPAVGFPVTVCVVCYGDHEDLARRFLSSLYRFTGPALFHLRAGLNEVVPGTRRLFEEAAREHGNVELFVEEKNVFKNPLMGRMFRSPPLDRTWTVWCDDDTCFTRPDWLHRLAGRIEDHPEVGIWGQEYALWRQDTLVLDWIRAAPWYRGLPFRQGTNQEGEPAVEFHFVTGGFWAMRSDVIRQLDWPDPRLILANEDFLLGEALRQNGILTGTFDYGVRINDAPRRNESAEEVHHLRF